MVESKTTTSLCTKLCVAYTIIIALISIGIFAWYTKTGGSVSFVEYEWGPWSSCNPDGYRTRNELCEDANCAIEYEACIYYEPEWSPWSPCTNLCGDGYQTRFWDCKGDPFCRTFLESQSCTDMSLCGFKCNNPMIGDGYCDDRFNLPIQGCKNDGGDCCGDDVNKLFCQHCVCLEEIAIDEDRCPFKIDLNNSRCNDFANIKECGYDGGDCCNPDSNFDFCTECQCVMTDVASALYQIQETVDLKSKCPFLAHKELIGDGYCQPKLNNADCSFDGGDCKGPAKAKKCPSPNPPNGRCDDEYNIPQCYFDNGECCGQVDLSKCEDCFCKDPDNTELRSIVKCKYPFFRGNGKCDDENNIAECQWDGGDCCGCYVEKGFCTECQCKDQSMLAMQNSPDWCCVQSKLNDGICHAENNNEGCFYDSLDCCQEEETCPLQGICDIGLLKNAKCDPINNKAECFFDYGACVSSSSEKSLLCQPLLYGDSFCDMENSQPQCNFDGGDCLEGQADDYTLWLGIGVTNQINNEFLSLDFKGQVEYFLPRFPQSLKATSYLLYKNRPFICGGEDENKKVYDRCYTLEAVDSLSPTLYLLWRQIDPMRAKRVEHAATLVTPAGGNASYMWIVGGLTKFESDGAVVTELLKSTEIYDFQSQEIFDGITLDFPIAGHCLIGISDDLILLTGGYSAGDIIQRNTFLYQMYPNLAITSANAEPMRTERKYHSCGKFLSSDNYEAVFAVGGIGYNEKDEEVPLSSAEAYYIALDEWVPIRPLPKNRYLSSVQVISSSRMIMIGGITDEQRQPTNYVYNHKTSWHLANFELTKGGRYGHVTLMVPSISQQMKANIAKQPNLLITHGLSFTNIEFPQLEFNCLRMQPEDTYCQSDLTFNQEIPATRLGSFAVGYNEEVMICGGMNTNRKAQKSCDLLKKKWHFGFKDMENHRSFASAAQAESKEWFITGGYMADSLNSLNFGYHITDTTLVINDKWQIREGPTMPYKLAGHCMVHIEDRYFMVVGGQDENIRLANPGAFYMNYITGDYMPLPYMKQSRMNLACIKHYSLSGDVLVIAAGGRYFNKPESISDQASPMYLDTTEVFSTKHKRWIEGPKLPFPLAFASSVVTPRESWIAGGRTDPLDSNMISQYILAVKEDEVTGTLSWQFLGYELKLPRHSFNVLSITTDNIKTAVNPDQEIIPRNYVIPKEPLALADLCENKQRRQKAIFCPSQHILVIKGNQVRDYKHISDRRVLVPYSNYSYPNWPQDVVSTIPTKFNEELGTFKSLSFLSNNLLVVVGGKLNSKVTTKRIGYTESNSNDNYLYGDVPKYHLNGGATTVGSRIWMVGGRNREGSPHSRTSVLFEGQWYDGPQMFFAGKELILEGMCVCHVTENIGFIAGGFAGSGLSELVLTYDFSNSLSNPAGWQKLQSIPGGPRYMPACTNVQMADKSYIILAGGITKLQMTSSNQIAPFAAAPSTLAYDPLERIWITLNPLPKGMYTGTMIMLGSQFYLFGARDTDTTTAHVLELRVDYSVPNSTLWEDYHWKFVNNIEMAKDLQFFTEDNVIIPYKVCEHCLTPGY